LVQPDADGLGIRVRVRPNETGSLLVKIACAAQSEILDMTAHYVSEFGELVIVRKADQATPLASGKYRIDSLELKLLAADGQVWHYWFNTEDRKYEVTIQPGQEALHQPLAELKVDVRHDATGKANEVVMVRPNAVAGPLYMIGCDVGRKHAESFRGVEATILLCDAGSEILDRANTGFM
jgi:hypothetical protein